MGGPPRRPSYDFEAGPAPQAAFGTPEPRIAPPSFRLCHETAQAAGIPADCAGPVGMVADVL